MAGESNVMAKYTSVAAMIKRIFSGIFLAFSEKRVDPSYLEVASTSIMKLVLVFGGAPRSATSR